MMEFLFGKCSVSQPQPNDNSTEMTRSRREPLAKFRDQGRFSQEYFSQQIQSL